MAFHGNIQFGHTPRHCNSVADWLASAAISLPFGFHSLLASFGDCHRLLGSDLEGGGRLSPPFF